MTLTITDFVTDSEVFCVAIAAMAERLNVLKRGGIARHMFAANPARHHTMQLTGYRLVDLVAGMAQSAHNIADSVLAAAAVSGIVIVIVIVIVKVVKSKPSSAFFFVTLQAVLHQETPRIKMAQNCTESAGCAGWKSMYDGIALTKLFQ